MIKFVKLQCTHIIVHLVKRGVLTLVGEMRRYKHDRYFYYYCQYYYLSTESPHPIQCQNCPGEEIDGRNLSLQVFPIPISKRMTFP